MYLRVWKILSRWLFPSKICIQSTIFNTFLGKIICHTLSLHSRGNGTSFAFMLYIVSANFCGVTFLNFPFFSLFYHLFICWRQRKIKLVTLSKSYLYKYLYKINFLFKLKRLVYWTSFLHTCLYFWTQIKHPKLFLKHNVWREKRAHCIAYNNICTTIFVQ